jgi:hypothetical protein
LRHLDQRITFELPDGRQIPGAPEGRVVITYGTREEGLRMVADLAHAARKSIEESDE